MRNETKPLNTFPQPFSSFRTQLHSWFLYLLPLGGTGWQWMGVVMSSLQLVSAALKALVLGRIRNDSNRKWGTTFECLAKIISDVEVRKHHAKEQEGGWQLPSPLGTAKPAQDWAWYQVPWAVGNWEAMWSASGSFLQVLNKHSLFKFMTTALRPLPQL